MCMNSYAGAWRQAMQDKAVRARVIQLAKARRPLINAVLVAALAMALVLAMLLSWLGGWWLLPAIAFATQARLWAWYLAHDCAHNAGFAGKSANVRAGQWCGALNGLGMFGFDEYKKEHNRHHAEKVDLLGVRVDGLLAGLAVPLARAVVWAERCYIPAMNYLIYLRSVQGLLHDQSTRTRTLGIVSIHAAGYLLLAVCLPAALITWWASSVIRIHVVRFVDCFQHAYEQVDVEAASAQKRSQDYEVAHTFSIPVAKKFTWLNIVILNFGYHNAHHAVPTCPWYALPQVDRLILGAMGVSREAVNEREDALSLTVLLQHYHRNLEARMLSNQQGYPYDEQGRFSLGRFQGAYTDNLLG